MMRKFLVLVLLIAAPGIFFAQHSLYKYPDQLKCTYFPNSTDDKPEFYNVRGLWHGFTNPAQNDTKNFGKFGGPYCLKTNKWVSQSLLGIKLNEEGKGNIPLTSAKEYELAQFPGVLSQNYTFPNYNMELKLSFVSQRTSLFQAFVINTSDTVQKLSLILEGEMFEDMGVGEKFSDGWIFKIDSTDDILWLIRFRLDTKMELVYSPNGYQFSFKDIQSVAPGDTLRMTAIVSQFFKGDNEQEVILSSDILDSPDKYTSRNGLFWDLMIKKMIVGTEDMKKLSVKSFQTLYLNLRSYLPGFGNFNFVQGTGIDIPYISTDESWLLSSSLIKFDTQLAMHQIASILISQNKDGSIDKYVSLDTSRLAKEGLNNRPMIAWTVWNIFLLAQDTAFLEAVIPMIENYHQYWYTYHDANKNGWCENADLIESPALNAMLFTEKHCMRQIYHVLGDTAKVVLYDAELYEIRDAFNFYFFNPELKTYCDIDIKTNEYEEAENVIGYCLWSGLATWEIAGLYSARIEDKIVEKYYEKLFAAGKYDIFYYYFLIAGLKSYKLNDISDYLKDKLLSEYLKTLNTKPLNSYDADRKVFVENSSLTASVLLLLLNYE